MAVRVEITKALREHGEDSREARNFSGPSWGPRRHTGPMRWVGDGADLWRVRVDLFAERREPIRRQASGVYERLNGMLTESDGDTTTDRGVIGVDEGTSFTRRNLIGMVFWVRADDAGAAAMRAIDVARHAGATEGAGPEFYDVIVIPGRAVVFPDDPNYPRRDD